jgi:hypothetical protein
MQLMSPSPVYANGGLHTLKQRARQGFWQQPGRRAAAQASAQIKLAFPLEHD